MWRLLKTTVQNFLEDEALSRGAAIAFYTVTSLAPVLLIVIAIAGLIFGRKEGCRARRGPEPADRLDGTPGCGSFAVG